MTSFVILSSFSLKAHLWKAALAANTRRTVADDDREDNR